MADKPNEDEGRVEKGQVATTCAVMGGDQDWLRLGVGVGWLSSDRGQYPSKPHPSSSNSKSDKSDAIAPPMAIAGLPKLAPVFPAATGGFTHLWPAPDQNPSSSSTFLRSFTLQRPMIASVISSSVRLDPGMRVISRPRRAQTTGLWLVLQEARDQAKKPLWPQTPKCYLKIKDGRMSIRLLMKYLSNKLGLEDESQVEITCRGQRLPPPLTLMHVRDSIWCLPETVEMQSNSSSTKYVMTLLYRSRNK